MGTTAVALRRPDTEIAELPRQGLQTIDEGRRALWAQLFFEDATDADVAFCVAFCAHRDLDPVRGEVVFNKFAKREQVKGTWQTTGYSVVPVVTAIGYRVQASRSGDYLGQTPREWCGPDGVWKQVWLEEEPPAAARVGILRRGCPMPIYAVAVFRRFAKYTDGKYGPVKLSGLWATHPDVMIATRAETAAFKLAFPETRRENDERSRVAYRSLPTGDRLRTIDGAIADDDGGEVFDAIGSASAVADRDLWSEHSRELHGLVAMLHPEEPDAHAIVHDLVCARFGVTTTKDATADQLALLAREIDDTIPTDDNQVEGYGEVVDAETGEIASPDPEPVEADEKTVQTWLRNIDRAKDLGRLDGLVAVLTNAGLASQRDIKSAIEIKRGELQTAAVDRAVTRTVQP